MVQGLPATFRCLDKDPQIIPCRRLPHKFGERLGPQSGIDIFGAFVWRGEAVFGHCFAFFNARFTSMA